VEERSGGFAFKTFTIVNTIKEGISMKHEARIKRTAFTKKFGDSYNKYSPEDGILLDFETENGVHYVRLTREDAGFLAKFLSDAEQEWKSSMHTPGVVVDDQNGT
jgi:hypothetical protein